MYTMQVVEHKNRHKITEGDREPPKLPSGLALVQHPHEECCSTELYEAS